MTHKFIAIVSVYVTSDNMYNMKKLLNNPPPAHKETIFVDIHNISVETISKGFWINDEFKLAQVEDRLYWIPPASILGIKKVSD